MLNRKPIKGYRTPRSGLVYSVQEDSKGEGFRVMIYASFTKGWMPSSAIGERIFKTPQSAWKALHILADKYGLTPLTPDEYDELMHTVHGFPLTRPDQMRIEQA